MIAYYGGDVKVTKYHNKITRTADGTFASRAEARYHQQLKLRALSGDVSNIRRQVAYPFVVNGVKVCVYIADFVYRERGNTRDTVADVKGVSTAVFKLKAKLFKAVYGYDILIIPASEI